MDNFVSIYNEQLNGWISLSQQYRSRRPHTCNLPRQLLKLILNKQAVKRNGKRSGNFELYHDLKNRLRAAFNQFYSNNVSSLINAEDKKQFYNYVNKRLGTTQIAHKLLRCADGLSDANAANTFVTEFSNNWTSDCPTTDMLLALHATPLCSLAAFQTTSKKPLYK